MTISERPPPIVDTHLHLDDPVFDSDRDEVVVAARSAGVRYFINIGYSPDNWRSSLALRERYPDFGLALGLHPQLAHEYDCSLQWALSRSIETLSPLAIGETGFDFSRASPGFPDQARAFQAQIELAISRRLPIIIHQRDAADALIAEVDRWPLLAPILLHSFDGTERLADWAVERGCYVGIGGLATKRSSAPLRELLTRVAVDRLLLETDSPYLAPPEAPTRRNVPANLPRIANMLAPLWNMSGQELCGQTSQNAATLFGPQVAGCCGE